MAWRRKRRSFESPDMTFSKVILTEGDRDIDPPRFGAKVQFAIPIMSSTNVSMIEQMTSDLNDSKVFVQGQSEHIMGSAVSEVDIVFEKCLATFHPGEKCEVTIRLALDLQRNSGEVLEDKEQYVTFEFELVLVSMENKPPLSKWPLDEKYKLATDVKAEAVDLFKNKRYLDAFHRFRLSLKLLTFFLDEAGKDESEVSDAEKLRLTLLSNITACQMQFKNHRHVITLSNKVLKAEEDNVKMLYRRGAAHLALKDFEEAKKYFIEASKLDPSNKAVIDKLAQTKELEKKHNTQMRQGMMKMFK